MFRRRDQSLGADFDDFTSGGRFDDPAGRRGIAEARRYRVIYAATQREAALGEAVAALRDQQTASTRMPEALTAIIQRNPELQEAGAIIPVDWWSKRSVGASLLNQSLRFVDLTNAGVLEPLWDVFSPMVLSVGFRRLDFGTLLGSNRRLTQELAGFFYELLNPDTDNPVFHGIHYVSSLDLSWRCWAIFDTRLSHSAGPVVRLTNDDPDLVAIAARYRLAIEGGE